MERVAIVGVGQTKYERGKTKNFAELVHEAARKAMDDAGMGSKVLQSARHPVIEAHPHSD